MNIYAYISIFEAIAKLIIAAPAWPSLDVLHLLAHLFDQGYLHVHTDVREIQRRRLRAQRVRLAVQFLDQKVQASTISPPSPAGVRSRRGGTAGA